jgi:hypothetical protein
MVIANAYDLFEGKVRSFEGLGVNFKEGFGNINLSPFK